MYCNIHWGLLVLGERHEEKVGEGEEAISFFRALTPEDHL
jgi:hypothetical protein